MYNDMSELVSWVLSWIRQLVSVMVSNPLLVVPLGLWVVGLVCTLFDDIKRRYM